MLSDKQDKLAYWSFLSLYVYTAIYVLLDAIISASAFFVLLYVSMICLSLIYVTRSWRKDIPVPALIFYNAFLVCNLICFIRGIFTASGYLDWKGLFTDAGIGLSLAIPLALVVGLNYENSARFLRLNMLLFKISFVALPFSIIIFSEIFARLVPGVIVFILFIPYLKTNKKILVIAVGLISAVIAFSWRTNIIHIFLSFAFLSIYYLRKAIPKFILNLVTLIFLSLPLYFLYQGTQGKSIFEQDENAISVNEDEQMDELKADTRTSLYTEVFADLKDNKKILQGKGANAKYKTEFDYELPDALGDQRPNVEVGFLKILLSTGIIGMVLYTIVIAIAVFYGINKTNNTLSKIIAFFLASHWTILFVENIVSYDMYFFFSWLCTGLCFSKSFRALNDVEIKEWFAQNL